MLIADGFGRVDAVLKRLPEGVTNNEWAKRIEGARKLVGEGGDIFASYPAIGESGAGRQPSLHEMGGLTALYGAFIDNPTVDSFLTAGPLLFSFGVPAECVPAAARIIGELRQSAMKPEDRKHQTVAMLAAYIALQLKDRTLADAVAELLIENASVLSAEEGRPLETLFRLIECAAADPDHTNRRKVLARRLEILTFKVGPAHLADLHDSLRVLQTLDVDLAQLLGKAVASARMGTRAA
jgi:hypothetical protein